MRGLLLGALLLAAWTVVPCADDVTARAFEVHHRSLADAADIVGAVLSDEGAVTLRPRLSTMVVEDHASILDRVEALLKSFDTAPRNIEITLSLFLGTRREPRSAREITTGEVSTEARGVMDQVKDFTKWSSYEPLGSQSVTGVEGNRVETQLSEQYRVVFTLQAVDDQRDKVKVDQFALQRIRHDGSGSERSEDLYKTAMVLTAGKPLVLGAARDPGSNRALFLMLQAQPR